MADKFPEISDVPIDSNPTGGDFLAREKEILGDEFTATGSETAKSDDAAASGATGATDATDAAAAAAAADEDDEFDDFQSQGTTAAAAPGSEKEAVALPQPGDDLPAQFGDLNLEDSEKVKEWRVKKDVQVKESDEVFAKKLEDLKQQAQKATDEFYENYNNKRDESISDVKKEEVAFLEKRDAFLSEGTVWDRVVELLSLTKNSNSIDEANYRDKTRFKEILLSLKGKTDVPGASGVSE